MRVVLGVTGGIAAYKAALVLRLLTEAGHRVRVVPTEAALRLVGRPTWEALSGEPVRTGVFDDAEHVDHVALGRSADLVLVVPATANTLARAAAGLADDLLTATLLTATCPVLLAPAMHTEMWRHPATAANVATLRARGAHVLDPDEGRLTGADSGAGRLPEPERIVAEALALVGGSGPAPDTAPAGTAGAASDRATSDRTRTGWAGRRVVVSAGGTQEPLDPVRFLGNRSTGRQGVAIAAAAARRGAEVVLAAANVCSDVLAALPPGVRVEPVGTALELQDVVRREAAEADVVVMAAAVADFRPEAAAGAKMKKRAGQAPPALTLVENPDILAGLAADRPRAGQVIVGFAAETGDAEGDVLHHGRAKARRKGADLLAVNEVGATAGFGDVGNTITVLDANGEVRGSSSGSKNEVAEGLLDHISPLLGATG